MLEALVAAGKAILDLLLKRGEHRQVKAQTALAEVQLKREESRIVPATMEDVTKYDRMARRLGRDYDAENARGRLASRERTVNEAEELAALAEAFEMPHKRRRDAEPVDD